jgi:hypothetical protein
MADLAVKKEEEVDSAAALEDAYEEVDDLEFYDNTNENERFYVARVPAYLWQVLSQSPSDDSDVRIGTIRQYVQPNSQDVSLPASLPAHLPALQGTESCADIRAASATSSTAC